MILDEKIPLLFAVIEWLGQSGKFNSFKFFLNFFLAVVNLG